MGSTSALRRGSERCGRSSSRSRDPPIARKRLAPSVGRRCTESYTLSRGPLVEGQHRFAVDEVACCAALRRGSVGTTDCSRCKAARRHYACEAKRLCPDEFGSGRRCRSCRKAFSRLNRSVSSERGLRRFGKSRAACSSAVDARFSPASVLELRLPLEEQRCCPSLPFARPLPHTRTIPPVRRLK
jgi:hypothetical protein